MLKKTIKYVNPFTEQEVSEEHWFHLSKADLVEMEMEDHKEVYKAKDGEELTGWEARVRRIVDSEDGKHIIAEFKDLIRRSYGKRDGDRFLKSQDIWEDFASTEAFSQLLYDICTDTDQAIEFWNGLIPKDLDKVAAELQARAARTAEQITPGEVTQITEAPSATPRMLTQEEVTAMDPNELKAGIADGRYKLSS